MSEEKSQSISLWLVNENAWEYNDEYYYQTEGYNTFGVFSDREVAEKVVNELTLRYWSKGVEDFISAAADAEEEFKTFCESRSIVCDKDSENTWDDFIAGSAKNMTETDILSFLSRIGVSFAHVGQQVTQVCLSETEINGGFCATLGGSMESVVRDAMIGRPKSDIVTIVKMAVGACKCDGCGYTNPAGVATCRLCNREIENEG